MKFQTLDETLLITSTEAWGVFYMKIQQHTFNTQNTSSKNTTNYSRKAVKKCLVFFPTRFKSTGGTHFFIQTSLFNKSILFNK